MDQRATLIENYAVVMEFPAFYYYNAKFVPNLKDHLVTMEFHIIPQNGKTKVQTTFQNGDVEENLFSEIYEQTGENIILTLYKQTERNGLVSQKELFLRDFHKSIMMFSKSGKHFAFIKKYDRDQNKANELQIFDSNDIY